MARTIGAVLNNSIGEQKREKIRKGCQKEEMVCPKSKQGWRSPRYILPPPPDRTPWTTKQMRPLWLPRNRQSPPAVAALSHSAVEQSWWHHTAQNNLLRHTAQGGKNRRPQHCWGHRADGAQCLPPHARLQTRKLHEITEAHLYESRVSTLPWYQ